LSEQQTKIIRHFQVLSSLGCFRLIDGYQYPAPLSGIGRGVKPMRHTQRFRRLCPANSSGVRNHSTPRWRLLNKHIAEKLGISDMTVKVHRGSLMGKMGAKSLAELVRFAIALETRKVLR